MKRLISSLCAVAFLGVIAVLTSHSAPTANTPCLNCAADKVLVPPPTGDADLDQANLDWVAATVKWRFDNDPTIKARKAKDEAQKRAWRGTRIVTKREETDEDTIALHDAVSKVFSTDPPAPQARTNAIQQHTAGYGCVGYYGSVESVIPNNDGWKTVIRVSPYLTGAGIPFTYFATVEEWQIGKDGSLKNLSCKAVPGITMSD
jgi:hypothetical protein